MSAKIAAALHQVMGACGYVQKTGKNAFHGYKYAGEADLLEKLRPAMLEAGLILLPSVRHVSPIDEHGNVTVHVDYTLLHKDGDVWPEKLSAVGCGNDRAKNGSVGDKGVYKAITGANKYLLFKLFQIETGDDPENEAHEPAPPPPPTRTPAGNREAIAYVALAKTAMQNAANKAELREWWEREKSNRQLHFTTSDDPLFCELREAFAKRGQSLPEFAQAAE